MTLDEALCRASLATAVLTRTRMSVRRAAVETTRALEARLREALAGERLRGAPNLVPSDFAGEFRAYRVNSFSKHGSLLPRDGREVLVLSTDGGLGVAKLHPVLGPSVRVPEDEELVLEDLEHFARVVQEALEKHVALSDKRAQTLARVEDLARRIAEAIGLQIR